MNETNIAGDAIERLCEITETRSYDVDNRDPGNAWVDGYIEGYAAGLDAASTNPAARAVTALAGEA